MKIKMSNSDKRLLLIFGAVLLLAAAYFFIFSPGMTKAQELEAQNETDRQTVLTLQNMVAMEDTIVAQTQEYTQQKEDIIAKYPADITTESVIAVLNDMENETGVHIEEISFSMHNDLAVDSTAETTADTEETEDTTETEDTGTEDTDAVSTTASDSGTTDSGVAASGSVDTAASVRGYYASIGVRYEGGYENLKSMVAYVGSLPQRTTITELSAAYDSETGMLSGTFILNMYYMTGTSQEYTDPEIGETKKGVSNIFGDTIEREEAAE